MNSNIRKVTLHFLLAGTAALFVYGPAYSQEVSLPRLLKSAAESQGSPQPQTWQEGRVNIPVSFAGTAPTALPGPAVASFSPAAWRSRRTSFSYQNPTAVNPSAPAPNSLPATMTAGEKLKYGFNQAFLSPGTYAYRAFSATLTQLNEEDQPHKDTGDKVVDGFSRFAIKFGTGATKSLLGSGVYPAIFKQDPRYRPSGRKGFKARALYAVSQVFVTYGDDGNTQVNISRLGGSMSAAALANVWERNTPGHDRIGAGPTFKRFASMVGFDIIRFVVLKEFGPDIKKKFGRK